jgi:hypothetical protein
VLDAVGSNIRIDTRGAEVMRILPRLNEDVNEEWISDKTRYSYDGLKRQRLDTPLVRKGDEFVPASWEFALNAIREHVTANKIKGSEMLAVAGDLVDAETLVTAKDLFNRLGSSNTYTALVRPRAAPHPLPLPRPLPSPFITTPLRSPPLSLLRLTVFCSVVQNLRQLNLSPDLRSNYLFNPKIVGIEGASPSTSLLACFAVTQPCSLPHPHSYSALWCVAVGCWLVAR